jgi:hypothetical protein
MVTYLNNKDHNNNYSKKNQGGRIPLPIKKAIAFIIELSNKVRKRLQVLSHTVETGLDVL